MNARHTCQLTQVFAIFVICSFMGFVVAAQVKPTPDIHYVPTPPQIVDAMLKLARLGEGDVVYDLGSGDGRIVIAAARQAGVRGVGIELDAGLIRVARAEALKARVSDKVTFSQSDLFATDLSEATVVTLYLSPSVNLRLRAKLQRELRPGTRIVSHRFPIGDWTPDEDVVVGGTHVYSWTIR
ncbi:MAG: methyltransferase domain-containing protein [Vicinamibacterales bacterium]